MEEKAGEEAQTEPPMSCFHDSRRALGLDSYSR